MHDKKTLPNPELSLLLDKFDAAWAGDSPPDISAYVAHIKIPELRREALLELVMIDLERRWRRSTEDPTSIRTADFTMTAGQSSSGLPGRPTLEDYLRAYPDLGPINRMPIDLVIYEYRIRCRMGESPNWQDYEQRFPSLQGQLAEALRVVDQELAGDGDNDNGEQAPDTTVWAWSRDLQPIQGYRLIRRLGKGAMGEVWEAEGPGGMPVAIKRVGLGSKCGEVELSALELLKRVRHPHLLSIHGYWLLAHELIIGIELADHCLSSLLKELKQKRGKGMSRVDATNYLVDAAEALDYLSRPIHRVNDQWVRIQHRDIKPANLLVQGGAVKVADFGLAKALEHVVQSLTISMTPAYAPPEFFRGETTPSSDQYSLGVTYYELRTGKVPFSGSLHEIMDGHLHQEPQLEELDEPERRIVARALAKNPELRWASCVKFIGELRRSEPATQPTTQAMPGRMASLFNRLKFHLPWRKISAEATAESHPDETIDLLVPNEATREFQGQPVTSGMLLVGRDLVPLPLKSTEFKVSVTVSTAEVTVKQKFRNDFERTVEATYVFPLPADAAVHRLVMHTGDRIVEGFVRERVEARTIYQEAKSEGHGAAILTEEAGNVFRVSVANILPGQEVRIEITYLQPLPCDEGQYRFVLPTVVPHHGTPEERQASKEDQSQIVDGPRLPEDILRGDTLSIEVDLNAGVPLCNFDSPSHDIETVQETGPSRVVVKLRSHDEIPNCDFVLNYRIAGPTIETALLIEPEDDLAGEEGTFLLLATPPRIPPTTMIPREYVILLDHSQAMAGESLRQAKQVARQLIEQLEPTDYFNLIAFGSEEIAIFNPSVGAADANVRRAVNFLECLEAKGLPDILNPLRTAFRIPSPIQGPCQRIIIMLTSGSYYHQWENPSEIRQGIGETRLVTVGIGTSVNRSLLDRLSRIGRGFAEYLCPGENVRRVIDRLLRRLGEPALTDVNLTWEEGNVTKVLPEPIPDLFAGRPLLIVGRYRGSKLPQVKLTGRAEGESYSITIQPELTRDPFAGVPLRTLWAQQCIAALADKIWEHPEEEALLRQRIVDLALRYRLASQYTSLVAVEYRSPAEREQARKVVTVEIPQLTPGGRPDTYPAASTMTFGAVGMVPPRTEERMSSGNWRIRGAGGEEMAPPEPDSLLPQEPSNRTGESLQAKLSRVRKPRVHIVYDVPCAGATQQRELPFVLGILADLHGPQAEVKPLAERKFLTLDRDNFSDFMRETEPSFDLRSTEGAIPEEGLVNSRLVFCTLSDFEPTAVRTQLEVLGANVDCCFEAVLRHPDFRQLKATWRGLSYLTHQSETSEMLKLRVMHATKQELAENFALHQADEESALDKKVYQNEFAGLGGQPFGMVIADYEFAATESDLELLENFARLGARSVCQFVVAASPSLFGLHDFLDLPESADLTKLHEQNIIPRWTSLRDSSDSKFLAVTLPKMQWGRPYDGNYQPTNVLHFSSSDNDNPTLGSLIPPERLCMIHSGYVWGACVAASFADRGSFFDMIDEGGRAVPDWSECTLIQNEELRSFGPAEIALDTERVSGLVSAGLMGLVNPSAKGRSPMFSPPVTLHRSEANAGSVKALAETLPVLLDCGRFSHYLVVMAIGRRKDGLDFDQVELWLNDWLEGYVAKEVSFDSEFRNKFPWTAARVQIQPNSKNDRCVRMIVSLKPRLPGEHATRCSPLRFEVEIPAST